jgi:two-component system OmpR family sensor kinase
VLSLRARLTCTLLIAFVAVGSLAMIAAYLNARQEVDEMFDFEIKAVALSIDPTDFHATPRDIPDDEILVQVWSGGGTPVYASDPTLDIPRAAAVGYSSLEGPSGAYRAYVRDVGASRVQVSQSLASRRTLAVEYSLRLLAPLLLMVPLMGAAIWWLTRRSLLPVGQLGADLAARTDGVLDPIEMQNLPEELLPLVGGFNRLLQRLKSAFDAQRTLVADAAHELRTPLAVVKIQAQTLERWNGASANAPALGALLEGVGRATRVVQQLLTLARHDAAALAAARVDLTELVRTTLADLLPLAAGRQIDMSFENAGTVVSWGDRGALEALIANLVDNAIKYTPAGGRIRVALRADSHGIKLQVADTGPGIPPEQRLLVLDRFYRLPGSPGVGSGLGLAIAAAVVQRHGGNLSLHDSADGGLAVDVTLPLAPA